MNYLHLLKKQMLQKMNQPSKDQHLVIINGIDTPIFNRLTNAHMQRWNTTHRHTALALPLMALTSGQRSPIYKLKGTIKVYIFIHGSPGSRWVHSEDQHHLAISSETLAKLLLKQFGSKSEPSIHLIVCNGAKGTHVPPRASFADTLHNALVRDRLQDIPVYAYNKTVYNICIYPYKLTGKKGVPNFVIHGAAKAMTNAIKHPKCSRFAANIFYKLTNHHQHKFVFFNNPVGEPVKCDAYDYKWQLKVKQLLNETSHEDRCLADRRILQSLQSNLASSKPSFAQYEALKYSLPLLEGHKTRSGIGRLIEEYETLPHPSTKLYSNLIKNL